MTAHFPSELTSRFEPVHPLGAGGFGAVWRANQVGLARPVAVKLLKPELSSEPGEVERFLEEARITAALSHPALVKVIDFGVVESGPWIAYELLEGEALSERVARAPLPFREAARVLAAVASGLAVAHERGVVHRDIKPENIFAAEGGEVKLTDFGIARWSESTRVHTATGVVMGSPAYLAPELIQGAAPSAASDVYALGVTFYQLVTGQLPFPGETLMQALEAHLKQPPPAPSERVPDLPAAADELVWTAMAKQPEERHRSAAAIAAHLERLASAPEQGTAGDRAAGERPAPRPARVPSRVPPRSSPRAPGRMGDPAAREAGRARGRARLLAVVAGLALCGIAIAALWAWWPGPAADKPPATPLPSPGATPAPLEGEPPRITYFDCFRGATTARVKLGLERPGPIELSLEAGAPPHAPLPSRGAAAPPALRHVAEFDGLEPDHAYRAVARSRGRALVVYPFRTVSSKEMDSVRKDFKLAGQKNEIEAGIVVSGLQRVARDGLHLPVPALMGVLDTMATAVGQTNFVDLAELWDAPDAASYILGHRAGSLVAINEARLLRILARAGRTDISQNLESLRKRGNLGGAGAIQANYLQAWLALEGLDPKRMDAHVDFPVWPYEGLATDFVERQEDAARQLLRSWLARRPESRTFAQLGLVLMGDPADLDAVRIDLLARGQAGLFAAMLGASPRQTARDMVCAELARPRPVEDLCWAVARRPRADCVPLLAPLVVDTQPARMRVAALCALGRQGTGAAVGPVLAQLEDPDPMVRRAAAWALGRLRAVRAAGALRALADSDRDTDGLAAWALGELGDRTQADFLRGLARRYLARGPRAQDSARAGLALLAAWRLDPAEARTVLTLTAAREQYAFLAHVVGLVGEPPAGQSSPLPEDVDVLFPFTMWDASRRSFETGAVVEARIYNHLRAREASGELRRAPERRVSGDAPFDLEPCLFAPQPASPGSRRICVVAPQSGPLVFSPLSPLAFGPFESVASDRLGGAALVVLRVASRPGTAPD